MPRECRQRLKEEVAKGAFGAGRSPSAPQNEAGEAGADEAAQQASQQGEGGGASAGKHVWEREGQGYKGE